MSLETKFHAASATHLQVTAAGKTTNIRFATQTTLQLAVAYQNWLLSDILPTEHC